MIKEVMIMTNCSENSFFDENNEIIVQPFVGMTREDIVQLVTEASERHYNFNAEKKVGDAFGDFYANMRYDVECMMTDVLCKFFGVA
jgi:hypothetical protein